MIAYTHRDGQIGLDREAPPDTHIIATGENLAPAIHDLTHGSWLVPWLEESMSTEEALRAVSNFAAAVEGHAMRRWDVGQAVVLVGVG